MTHRIELDTVDAQAKLDVIVNSNEPAKVELVGTGHTPLLIVPKVNRTEKLVIDGAEASVISMRVQTEDTGHLMRHLVLRDISLRGTLVLNGGDQNPKGGGYQGIYTFDVERINARALRIHGAVFEGRFTAGRIEAAKGGFFQPDPILFIADEVPSSLTFDGQLTVSGNDVADGAVCKASDVRWRDVNFLHTLGPGLQVTNNVTGIVDTCHFERNNLAAPGPALHVINRVRVRDMGLIHHEAAKTTVAVEGYAPWMQWGEASGFIQYAGNAKPIPFLKRNALWIRHIK